jgi:hypothetical protein
VNKGLLVNVYRAVDGRDCTNGGVTSTHALLTAVELGVDGPFEASNDRPAVHLGRWMGRLIAVPEDLPRRADSHAFASLNGWMFGGNFIYTSDSRFPGESAVPVFDRREF